MTECTGSGLDISPLEHLLLIETREADNDKSCQYRIVSGLVPWSSRYWGETCPIPPTKVICLAYRPSMFLFSNGQVRHFQWMYCGDVGSLSAEAPTTVQAVGLRTDYIIRSDIRL
jgi:hypothetical protein